MYKSKIKSHFRYLKDQSEPFFEDKEYIILCDMPYDKVLIYDPDIELLYDLYKNKLEEPRMKIYLWEDVYVEAKKPKYVNEHNLVGTYKLCKITDDGKLYLREVDENYVIIPDGEKKIVYPSRVKVVKFIEKEKNKDEDIIINNIVKEQINLGSYNKIIKNR